ncbi:MAG TPA: GNAT family N-acetyltransferase [Gaiellaceae bacterium]|nr:GNAT family N-acetyltransferase [Gaiellaceae bacterium]
MQAPARTELADDALVLRPWRLADVPRVAEICQDPEISRWTRVPSPYSDEHARTWIEQTERDWDDGRHAAFAVTGREAGEVLGAVGLRLHEDYALQGSIGYWVAREARRRGVATSALRLVAQWALRELGLPRVQLVTDPENEPSQRVAEGAGFQREGLLRSYIELQGSRRDCVLYSLLEGDLKDGNQE